MNVVSDSLGNKMGERKFFVGGNWKMNGSKAMIDELSGMLNEKCAGKETEVGVGVPSAYLMYTRDKVDKSVGVAAQNCYKAEKGAFTGTVSPFLRKKCSPTFYQPRLVRFYFVSFSSFSISSHYIYNFRTP